MIPICGGIVILRSTWSNAPVAWTRRSWVGGAAGYHALSTALLRTGSDCRILREERGYHLVAPAERRPAVSTSGVNRLNGERARWWRNASDAEIACAD